MSAGRTLRVWLVRDGESIAMRPEIKRQRTGMLADALRAAGHTVEWWTSTHHHFTKQLWFSDDHEDVSPTGVQLHYLHAGAYRRNISLARIKHHRRFAAKLTAAFESALHKPDVIVACYPIIEAVKASIDFGKAHGIPVIVDVRDQWPDTFVNYAPKLLRPVVGYVGDVLYPYAAAVIRAAQGVVAMSHPVLEWALKKAGRSYDSQCMGIFYLSTDLDPPALDALPEGKVPLFPKIPEGVLRCTYLGTLNNTADLATVAQAILHINAKGLGKYYHFFIGGDGPLMGHLQEMLGALGNVEIAGWLNKGECHRLLRQTDVALLTGVNEAMPNKLFDYTTYGLPMVCSFQGESRSFIAQHEIGEICNARDPAALVTALETIRCHGVEKYREKLRALPPKLYRQADIYGAFTRFIEAMAQQRAA
jgi:glycosyltransferase involved in cell wall biosynthesis